MDFRLLDPKGNAFHTQAGAGEVEAGAPGTGGRGPWRACFRVAGGALLKPSVMVKLSYFVLSLEEHAADAFVWEEEEAHKTRPDAEMLGARWLVVVGVVGWFRTRASRR